MPFSSPIGAGMSQWCNLIMPPLTDAPPRPLLLDVYWRHHFLHHMPFLVFLYHRNCVSPFFAMPFSTSMKSGICSAPGPYGVEMYENKKGKISLCLQALPFGPLWCNPKVWLSCNKFWTSCWIIAPSPAIKQQKVCNFIRPWEHLWYRCPLHLVLI